MKVLEDTHTDVCLNMINHPFLTLKEDELIKNLWHHPELVAKFYLTAKGFRVIRDKLK